MELIFDGYLLARPIRMNRSARTFLRLDEENSEWEPFDAEMNRLEDEQVRAESGDERIKTLREQAEDLRNGLLTLIMTPIDLREPVTVQDVTADGTMLTIQTIGETDERLLRLAGECGRLAQAALMQRLAYEAGA